MKFTITLLTSTLMLVAALPASAVETRESSGSLSTSKAIRDAEKTLVAVSTWNTKGAIAFNDDASRAELFNLHSSTRRLLRSLSILNAREPLHFFDQYSAFATKLSDLHKAVALKSDWAPLIGDVIQASTNAINALKRESPVATPTLAGTTGSRDVETPISNPRL